MSKLAPYAKSIAAGLAGGLTTLYTALADSVVSNQEWVGVGLGVLAGLGITYIVPNRSNTPAA